MNARVLFAAPLVALVLMVAGCGGHGSSAPSGSFEAVEQSMEAVSYRDALVAFYNAATADAPLRAETSAVVDEAGKDLGIPSSQIRRDLEDAAATAFEAGCDACADLLRREADNH